MKQTEKRKSKTRLDFFFPPLEEVEDSLEEALGPWELTCKQDTKYDLKEKKRKEGEKGEKRDSASCSYMVELFYSR